MEFFRDLFSFSYICNTLKEILPHYTVLRVIKCVGDSFGLYHDDNSFDIIRVGGCECYGHRVKE
jgi:hypothetical protein